MNQFTFDIFTHTIKLVYIRYGIWYMKLYSQSKSLVNFKRRYMYIFSEYIKNGFLYINFSLCVDISTKNLKAFGICK